MAAPESVPSRRRDASPWPDVALAVALIAGLIAVLLLEVRTHEAPEFLDPVERLGKTLAIWLAFATEMVAAAVIMLGTLRCAWAFFRDVFADDMAEALGAIRLRLGRVLVLGLELTLAADILQTAFAPTRAEILTLAAVVLLRTLLNLFLEREIRAARTLPEVPDADEA